MKTYQAPESYKCSRFLTNDMVDIFVGAERKKYHLHRDLLCGRSEFFKASFMGSFKEAGAEEMALPEDNVVSFELLVGWLYGGSLIRISSEKELPAYTDLVILAQKLCLEQLQNETMDHIVRFYRTSSPQVTAHTIRSIYEKTSEEDPLRKLIIRCASWTVVSKKTTVLDSDIQSLLEGGGDIAVDFTSLLATYYSRALLHDCYIDNSDPRRLPSCLYHKHKSTPSCLEPWEYDHFSWIHSTAGGS